MPSHIHTSKEIFISQEDLFIHRCIKLNIFGCETKLINHFKRPDSFPLLFFMTTIERYKEMSFKLDLPLSGTFCLSIPQTHRCGAQSEPAYKRPLLLLQKCCVHAFLRVQRDSPLG